MRYEIVYVEDFIGRQPEDVDWDTIDPQMLIDPEDSYPNNDYYILFDHHRGEVVFRDGGEPEDMILPRNLRILVDLLNESE